MIIDVCSDLHGHYPKLEGGDLLIVAGDLTARHTLDEHFKFLDWFEQQPYKRRIFIAGNHDEELARPDMNGLILSGRHVERTNITYLCDSGTEFVYYPPIPEDAPDGFVLERKTLKIWGSPWSLTFPGINPNCTAFTGTESDLKAKFDLIPDDIDILVTHSPPFGILDKIPVEYNASFGSISLKNRIWQMENPPKLVVFGHIHEGYGTNYECWYEGSEHHFHQRFINCSHVNEHYEPVNKPIRVIL